MKKRLYDGKPTVKDRILERIKRSRYSVFIPTDFEGITSYPQLLRALKILTKEQKIIHFGYGAYAKAEINPLNNRVYPICDMLSILQEFFKKLKIKWDYSESLKAYNDGKTTQIPVKKLLVIKNRFARKLKGAQELYARQ